MDECTLAEYSRATCVPWAEKRIMDTSRTQNIEWTVMGKSIASCVKLYKRGKISQVYYYCDKASLAAAAK